MDTKYQKFLDALQDKIDKSRIYTDGLRSFAWGTDASFYRQVPKVVIRTVNEDEVVFPAGMKDLCCGIEVGYSNSRTCEIGLQHHSGIPYVSIIYLVNACSTARQHAGS